MNTIKAKCGKVFTFIVRNGKKMKSGDSGFTIIEVLIAIVILAIGLLALSKMQIASIQGNQSAMKFTSATVIAQQQIETLMATPYDSLVTLGGATTIDADNYKTVWAFTSFEDLDGDGNNEVGHVNVIVTDPLNKIRANINFIKTADL